MPWFGFQNASVGAGSHDPDTVPGSVRKHLDPGALLHQQRQQALRRGQQGGDQVLYCTVLYRTVLYCGDQGRHQHQEGGAHQHQLQRPHVGHRQQAAASRSVANKYHEYNVDSRLTILSTI